MKIGLLGGSFNPPHKGHIHISLEVIKHMRLNQIWWLPTKQNPLKKDSGDFDKRLLQCYAITKNESQIKIKNYEKNLKSNYTIDLVNDIIKKYPHHQFYWVMGADSIVTFHLWKNWQEIVKLIPLIVCNRSGYFYKAMKSKAFLYAKNLNRCYFLKIAKCDISSTRIRKKNANKYQL